VSRDARYSTRMRLRGASRWTPRGSYVALANGDCPSIALESTSGSIRKRLLRIAQKAEELPVSDTRIRDSSDPHNSLSDPAVTHGGAVDVAQPKGVKKRRYPKVRQYHGLTTTRTSLQRLGEYAVASVLDDENGAATGLREWRDEIAASVGSAMTPMDSMTLELACRDRLMLDAVDRFILGGKRRLINKRRRAVYPIVAQRAALVRSLADHLKTLSALRRTASVPPEAGPSEEEKARKEYLINKILSIHQKALADRRTG
jgi:hypothetical protein